MQRLIFHIDVNSAFLSWEAAERVRRGKPDLRLIPSAIGGDPMQRTGIILAKSIPAKKFGVKTGEPTGSALRKCPQLYIAKPDFSLYIRNSEAFMNICREYTPTVEKFSIDECFLDMTGMERVYPDLIATAHEIKDRIKRELGFTVNVGVGNNKFLAKMASDFEKPDKVHTLFSNEIEQKMWGLPVSELFGVGKATAEKLRRHYIMTIGELANSDLDYIRRIIGSKAGIQLHGYANGIDRSPVAPVRDEAKSYSNSTTTSEDVTSMYAARAILLALTDSTSARMRHDGKKTACISVTMRDGTFANKSHQRKLDIPTDVTTEIFAVAAELFEEMWDEETPLRLLGVALTELTDSSNGQLSFFTEQDPKRERDRKVDKTVDYIRTKFGSSAITRGSICGKSDNIGKKHKAQMDSVNHEG